MAKTIENVYDEINYMTKEMAGLPPRYYMLGTDFVHFLEKFVETLDKFDNSDNMSDINISRELLEEALELVNNVESRRRTAGSNR